MLLTTGNLQGVKKCVGDDRGDTFIWLLNRYFREESEIILNHATPELVGILRAFLDSFKIKNYLNKSIYNYCDDFYQIKDRKLIDHLINSGSKAIDTPERVCEYIDLAIEFWSYRKKYRNLHCQSGSTLISSC